MLSFKEFLTEELRSYKWLNNELKFLSWHPRNILQAMKEIGNKKEQEPMRGVYDFIHHKFYLWLYTGGLHVEIMDKFNIPKMAIHFIVFPDKKRVEYDPKQASLWFLPSEEDNLDDAVVEIEKWFLGYRVFEKTRHMRF